MLNGMTGFGRSQLRFRGVQLTLQLSSVNHRFFEVSFHIPESLIYLEDKIKDYLHKRIRRGRLTFNLFVSGNLTTKVRLDKKLAREYFLAMRALKKELALTEEIGLRQLTVLPGVLSLEESRFPEEVIWPKIEKLLCSAAKDLLRMRLKEGRLIEKDVLLHLARISQKALFVKKRAPVAVKERCKRLEGSGTSPEEINAAIKNCDISEEVSRLFFHIKSLADKIKTNSKAASLGKELDFISQEMQREANTMGAKAQDAPISSAVIELKSRIEKIREQIQNAE